MKTQRLLLRQWKETDFEPFARLNADADVMKFFPKILTHNESYALATKFKELINQNGWGLWAVELLETGEFIGTIGLKPIHLDSALEIGWRLAKEHWGNGYATEGALEALQYGFETLKFETIVSITMQTNLRSQAVMKKIGMKPSLQDHFNQLMLNNGHLIHNHVLYIKHPEEISQVGLRPFPK